MDRPYRRIACCIDNDGMADDVLREGIRLADGALGALTVVHVLAPPQALIASSYAYVAPVMEVPSDAEAWLEDVTREVPEATRVLLDGFPAKEVCAWARSSGVEIIVAAARRSLVERVMLGGFASHIAYHAPCSVLLVHPPPSGPRPPGPAEKATGSRASRRPDGVGGLVAGAVKDRPGRRGLRLRAARGGAAGVADTSTEAQMPVDARMRLEKRQQDLHGDADPAARPGGKSSRRRYTATGSIRGREDR